MTVRLPVESGAPALGELLGFGDDIEVIGPARLRREIAEAIGRMGTRYG
jgi:predicted DNA-binding transcriptional regulator YafY